MPSYQEIIGGSNDLEQEEEDGIVKMKRCQHLQQTGKGEEGEGEGEKGEGEEEDVSEDEESTL